MARSYCLLGASMAPKQTLRMRIPLTPGKTYLWIAAGDSRAQDVDLKVIAPNAEVIAKDERRDPAALVRFQASQTGMHSIALTLFDATDASFVALVLMEEGGWSIPLENLGAAMGRFVATAGGAAGTVDRESGGLLGVRLQNGSCGWCVFGTVLQAGEQRAVENLSLGKGPRILLGVGCSHAGDIDLEVREQVGGVITADTQPDATPVCMAVTDAETQYEVTTSLIHSRGAALTLTGILKVEPVLGTRLTIRPLVARW